MPVCLIRRKNNALMAVKVQSESYDIVEKVATQRATTKSAVRSGSATALSSDQFTGQIEEDVILTKKVWPR